MTPVVFLWHLILSFQLIWQIWVWFVFFNGPSLHKRWHHLQSIANIKEIENFLSQISKKYAQVLLFNWKLKLFYFVSCLFNFFTLLNVGVCLPLLLCSICVFGGTCHFSFSFSKFKGSYVQKLIQFERTLMQRKSRIDGHFIYCWIQFLVMVTRVFKITWEKSIKFI